MNARSIVAVLFSMLMTAQVSAVDEGIDFTTLENPVPTGSGDKIEVLELFWYSCPHCYYLEPTMDKWKETKPDNVEFAYLPAVFNQRTAPYARALYAAESLGVLDKLHLPLFSALHDKKRRISTDDQLIAFAAEQGIDEAQFRAAMSSFVVDMAVRRAADITRRSGVDGVPALLINGKYVTSPSQVGSRDKMVEVLNRLIAVETQMIAEESTTSDDDGETPVEQSVPASETGS